jgi:hypothetical protein
LALPVELALLVKLALKGRGFSRAEKSPLKEGL